MKSVFVLKLLLPLRIMDLRIKLRLHAKALPQYILVLCSLILTAWFTGKYIEAGLFAISFCALRYQFTNILHCSTTFKCTLLTNGIIFVAIPVTLPVTGSLFGSLLMSFAVNYFANLVASNFFRESERVELKALQKEKRDCSVYSLNEESLRGYCKSYNLDLIDEEIVIQRLIYHRKGKDLYTKIGYSKPQMIRREKAIESKLNIKLKDR